MSSASQIDPASMSENQLVEMLSKVVSSRETEELRARLPAQLAPFAGNISIIKPIQNVCTSPTHGIHGCACEVKERRISMSVAVVPEPHLQPQDSEEPYVEPLELLWQDWGTTSRYLVTESADSHVSSISLEYGSPHCEIYSLARAYVGLYADPGISTEGYSHGGIKFVVEEVVQDMGFREHELDNNLKLEVLEALLGDDARELLDSDAVDAAGTTLRKIIEDELEHERDDGDYH